MLARPTHLAVRSHVLVEVVRHLLADVAPDPARTLEQGVELAVRHLVPTAG